MRTLLSPRGWTLTKGRSLPLPPRSRPNHPFLIGTGTLTPSTRPIPPPTEAFDSDSLTLPGCSRKATSMPHGTSHPKDDAQPTHWFSQTSTRQVYPNTKTCTDFSRRNHSPGASLGISAAPEQTVRRECPAPKPNLGGNGPRPNARLGEGPYRTRSSRNGGSIQAELADALCSHLPIGQPDQPFRDYFVPNQCPHHAQAHRRESDTAPIAARRKGRLHGQYCRFPKWHTRHHISQMARLCERPAGRLALNETSRAIPSPYLKRQLIYREKTAWAAQPCSRHYQQSLIRGQLLQVRKTQDVHIAFEGSHSN